MKASGLSSPKGRTFSFYPTQALPCKGDYIGSQESGQDHNVGHNKPRKGIKAHGSKPYFRPRNGAPSAVSSVSLAPLEAFLQPSCGLWCGEIRNDHGAGTVQLTVTIGTC